MNEYNNNPYGGAPDPNKNDPAWNFNPNQNGNNQYNAYPPPNNQGGQWAPPPGDPKPAEGYQWNYESYNNNARTDKPKKSKGLVVFASILSAILVVGLLTLSGLGLYAAISGNFIAPGAAPDATLEQVPSPDGVTLNSKPSAGVTPQILTDGPLTTQQIAKKVLPSVVGVVNYLATGDLMSIGQSQGSGIIMSADGYIITNAHVVADHAGLKVVLYDGTEYAATLIGSDVRSDLAVLKIDATDLPYAEFGNSAELEIGEKVVAIGNPGGLELAGSVTEGIVSALNRSIGTAGSDTINSIQTDAAINPGNSGGALVNEYGQVVGINSAKIAQVEYEGIGFAIAINEAQPILNDLKNSGVVRGRVKIGVGILEVDEYLAELNGLPTGIFVRNVEENSDAFKQGVIPGDLITHVNGTRVNTLADVRTVINGYQPNDAVTLSIYRKTTFQAPGKELEITIKLMEDLPAQ